MQNTVHNNAWMRRPPPAGSLFSWHPTCMAVGFLGFMAEGVMASISFRGLEGNERLRKIWQHLAWQALAVVCIVGGFAAIYQNKVRIDLSFCPPEPPLPGISCQCAFIPTWDSHDHEAMFY